MIRRFYEKTGCPVIINTSFNVRGEPIVCSPEHAYRCFMATNMDVLVLENQILYKDEQPDAEEHEIDELGHANNAVYAVGAIVRSLR